MHHLGRSEIDIEHFAPDDRLTIFGNERLTAGGNVKRAKKRVVSVKKRVQD